MLSDSGRVCGCARGWNRQQHPISCGCPFPLKGGAVFFQKLSPGCVIQQNHIFFGVYANDNHVVQDAFSRRRLESSDEGPSLVEVLLQIIPSSGKSEGFKTVLSKIPHHV